jgi:pilus assembly protein CpaB
MNRSRLLMIAFLALLLGAVVSYLAYRALQASTGKAPVQGIDVVVAAHDIQVGAKIEDSDLKVVKLPPTDLPQGVFRQKSSIVGRGAVQSIAAGEFILPNKLAAENAGSGLPSLIPPGMRAVSVRVNDVVAVAGFVQAGTRVDVLVTGTPTGGSEPVTTTVLSNVAVLAAGTRMERNTAGEAQSVPVITLLLSPEDAQKITLASSEGRIQLALRNPVDVAQVKPEVVRKTTLYRGEGVVEPPQEKPRPRAHKVSTPAPAPPPPYTIEVIRGSQRETKDVTKF